MSEDRDEIALPANFDALHTEAVLGCERGGLETVVLSYGGPKGSNPSSSSGESCCEPDFLVEIVTVGERNPGQAKLATMFAEILTLISLFAGTTRASMMSAGIRCNKRRQPRCARMWAEQQVSQLTTGVTVRGARFTLSKAPQKRSWPYKHRESGECRLSRLRAGPIAQRDRHIGIRLAHAVSFGQCSLKRRRSSESELG
jgi:hypothetical protein